MTLLRFAPIVVEFFGTLFVWLDTQRLNARNPPRFGIGDPPGYNAWYYHKSVLGFSLLLLGILLQGVCLFILRWHRRFLPTAVSQTVAMPASTGAPSLEKITLARRVIVQALYGSTTLPVGTEVELVSQDASNAHIRYAGRDLIIPSAAIMHSK